jgi:dTMP kinase
LFITFEGIEGCGKTTQIGRLEDRLKRHEISIIRTSEPGGTRIGQSIRQILLSSHNQTLSPLAELTLYAADRAQHIEEVIKPALSQGKWILCDRYADATIVYQGLARGMDMELIRTLNEKVTQGVQPDITFLLDCPVEIGLDRARRRNQELAQEGQGRFEQEALDFHRAVRKGYLDLAKEDQRFVIINAASSEDVVEETIFNFLDPYVAEKTGEGYS